tara:strand:- start:26522 stop:27139 length:618 start_codon:yes stop_codon:yes gene_type:complete
LSKDKYNEPKITINKVYTRTGDLGMTSLVGGQSVSKSVLRICAYGKIDELNSYIGACKEYLIVDSNKIDSDLKRLINVLYRIQNELFNVGNMLATLEEDIKEGMPKVEVSHIEALEKEIDYFNNGLPALKSFVLPGGSKINVWFHIARTVCRNCERKIVDLSYKEKIDVNIIKYLNRLSDALFVFSRWSNNKLSVKETLWNPNQI